MIDLSPVQRGELKIGEFAKGVTFPELAPSITEMMDAMIVLVRDLSDAECNYVSTDPTDAETVGWTVGHVIAHYTASTEENAAVSSILARGIAYPFEPRLRVETDWTMLNTTAACLQRLEESRRMQLAYLNTWPDTPRLDTERALPEAFAARVGPINAVASILLGFTHGAIHLAHMPEIVAQAKKVPVM